MLLNCLFFSIVRPNIEFSGPSKPLQKGDRAILTCKVIESFPEPKLTISKNGDLLLDGVKRTLTLSITNITERAEGKYTCKAENDGGDFTESIYLTVRSKFIIIIMNIVTIKSISILYH